MQTPYESSQPPFCHAYFARESSILAVVCKVKLPFNCEFVDSLEVTFASVEVTFPELEFRFPIQQEIKDNKLELGVNEYLSLKEIDSLVTNINNGISFISQSGKNYSTSVKMLLQAAEIIRKAGNFTDEISLELQGNILPSEL